MRDTQLLQLFMFKVLEINPSLASNDKGTPMKVVTLKGEENGTRAMLIVQSSSRPHHKPSQD
jgi:hypothetical protein